MHLKTLIDTTENDKLNEALRRGFTAYTPSIDVTDCEQEALIIMLNLAYKRSEKVVLRSKRSAKRLLLDEKVFNACINEIKWFHTHNLKYPDIRVSHQRLISEVIDDSYGLISSDSFQKQFGWSHNSSEINHAKPFLVAFMWWGEQTNLASLMAQESALWVDAFRTFGLTKKHTLQICETIRNAFLSRDLPHQISEYTNQLQFPFEDRYLSVSPVVSHSVMAELQQACRSTRLRKGIISHDKPANVGELPSSLGGNVNVLRYFPKTQKSATASESQNDEHYKFLNESALKRKALVDVFSTFSGSKYFNTLRQKRIAKIAATKELRVIVFNWLSKLISAANTTQSTDESNPLLSMYLNSDTKALTIELSGLLNQSMSQVNMLKRYAYHPDLMPILKRQIKFVLTHKQQDDDENELDDIVYIHCKKMRVFEAEAMANPYIVGMPSMTALEGLAHQFQRKLNQILDSRVNVIGSAVYIHSYKLHNDKQAPEPSKLSKAHNKLIPTRSAVMHKPKCDMTLDLVFRVHCNIELQTDLSETMLKTAFPTRYAGGTLHPPSLYESLEWCELFKSPAKLFDKVSATEGGGSWLYPTCSSADTFEQLEEQLNTNLKLRPTHIGFLSLEEPCEREGALTKEHCYVEPVLGLLECVDAVSVRLSGSKHFLNNAFWAMSCKKTSMLMKRAKFEYD